MLIKSENKNSEISVNMNNLGMAMEKLAIIRWINVPFQAIISLFVIFLKFSYFFENFRYANYYLYEVFWIPLIFGILYVFVSFSTLLRFMQYLLNLWNLGKSLQNSLIKKASIYQLIRIGLYGFIIILSVFLGFLILIPYYQFFSYKPEIAHIPEYTRYPNPNFNFFIIIIVSLLILFFIVVMKVLNILSIVLIDNWADRLKLKNSSNEKILQLSSGTNLMKIALFLELVNNLFGSIFFNIGLAKASQGFKKYSYQFVIDSDENNPRLIPSPKIQTIKNYPELMKIPPQLHNSIQGDIKNEIYVKFCSYCGVVRSNNHARYCFNCGSEYLEQSIKKKVKTNNF